MVSKASLMVDKNLQWATPGFANVNIFYIFHSIMDNQNISN
jgi:hypothetical protein